MLDEVYENRAHRHIYSIDLRRFYKLAYDLTHSYMHVELCYICFIPSPGILRYDVIKSFCIPNDTLFYLRFIKCGDEQLIYRSLYLGFVRASARLDELLMNPIFFISRASYTCLAVYIYNVNHFSFVKHLLDMTSSKILASVSICMSIGCLRMNSNCLLTQEHHQKDRKMQ